MSKVFAHNARTLASIAVLAVMATEARADRPSGSQIGPYAVGHISYVIDGESGRQVAVQLWYPAEPTSAQLSPEATYPMDPFFSQVPPTTSSEWEARGYDPATEGPNVAGETFPLVIFSSGLGVSAWSYLFAGTRLASHGFIVAATHHYGEAVWPWEPWQGLAMIVRNRPRDVSAVLTDLLNRNETRGDLLHRSIDTEHLIAAGHSLGGYAALASLGGDDEVCDSKLLGETQTSACGPTPADTRFGAMMSLDGSGQFLRYEEMGRIEHTALIMGEGIDAWIPFPPPYRSFVSRPHAAIDGTRRSVRVDVETSDHFSFCNLCDGARLLIDRGGLPHEIIAFVEFLESASCNAVMPAEEAHRLINKYMVAFLKSKVLGDDDYAKLLTPRNAAENEPMIEIFWHEHCGDSLPTQFTYRRHMDTHECVVTDKNPPLFF